MLTNLFFIFFKINCLSPSGPASIGLTQKLVVPNLISQEQFLEAVTLSSSIPGSDAIQMAYQIGYQVDGVLGAIVCILGALFPTLIIMTLILLGMKWVSPHILKSFFGGVIPAMAVFLIYTAITLVPTPISYYSIIIALVTIFLIILKVPITIIIIFFGLMGILFK